MKGEEDRPVSPSWEGDQPSRLIGLDDGGTRRGSWVWGQGAAFEPFENGPDRVGNSLKREKKP